MVIFMDFSELTADGGAVDWVLHWTCSVPRVLLYPSAHGERATNDQRQKKMRRMHSSLFVEENVDIDVVRPCDVVFSGAPFHFVGSWSGR